MRTQEERETDSLEAIRLGCVLLVVVLVVIATAAGSAAIFG